MIKIPFTSKINKKKKSNLNVKGSKSRKLIERNDIHRLLIFYYMLPYAQLHYKIVSHRFTSLDLEPIHATPRRQFWGHRASTMNIFHGTFVCIFFKQRMKSRGKVQKVRLYSINVVRISFFFFCELSSIPSCLLFQFDGVNLNRYKYKSESF